MKIATLQFNPSLGAVQHNIDKANALISELRPGQVDILVLPELAFTGYNFPSKEAIKPYLEVTAGGPSAEWAIQTARRLQCYVTVGYPEVFTQSVPNGSLEGPLQDEPKNFNATVTVSPTGEVISNYRKSFLYYTDETWATEGYRGTPGLQSALERPFFVGTWGQLGTVGHGICMDINPYRFITPFDACEFANTMLKNNVRLVVLSMAWLTHRTPEEISQTPDRETVAYWRERFLPFIEASVQTGEEIVVVFANRCGTEGNRTGSVEIENGVEVEEGDRVCYAGSSCVMRFVNGEVRMSERGDRVAILGKAEEGCLVVDTSLPAKYSLQPGSSM